MKTEVKEIGKNIVEVDIEIESKVSDKEYEKACRRIAQSVNIAGFRKGKAPRNIIERHVGVEAVKREALDAMLPRVFTDVIREKDYELISEPTLTSYTLETGKPCTVKVQFELRPEVKLEAYKGLTVECEEYVTEADAMDKELARLAERYAEMVKVEEERKTNANDIVMIDFEGSANGELIKGGAAKNYMLDLAHSNFIPGFAEQLVDKELETEFTIQVKFPEEYHDEKLKGADAEFKITIHEIKEKKVPELNDELAKKLGDFKTLDELKADIQKYLDGTAKAENEKRSYEAIFNKILDGAQMDIHDAMVEREADAMMQEMKMRAAQYGQDFEATLEKEGKDKVRKEMETEALSRIKNSLVVSKIAKDEKIMVHPVDLQRKLEEVSRMYGVNNESMLKEMYKNVNLIKSLSQQIVSEKVSRFILDNNKVEYKK